MAQPGAPARQGGAPLPMAAPAVAHVRDSIRRQLVNLSRQDTLLADTWLNLGWTYRLAEADTAFVYLEKGHQLAEQLQWQAGIAKARLYQGAVNRIVGNYALAYQQVLEAQKLFEALSDQARLADCHNNLGIILGKEERWPEAIAFFEQALAYGRQHNNDRLIGTVLNNLAALQLEQKDYAAAIQLLQEAYPVSIKIGDKLTTANLLRNLGKCYLQLGRYDSAIYYLRTSRTYFQVMDSRVGQTTAMQLLAKAHLKTNRLDLAKPLADSSLATAMQLKGKEQIRDGYELMYLMAEQRGDLGTALRYHKLWYGLADSLVNDQIVKKLANLQASHDLAAERARNQVLQAEQAAKNRQLVWAGLVVLALVGASVLLLRSYLAKRTAYQLLAQTRQQEEQKNQELLARNQELAQLNQQLAGLNQEQAGLIGVVAHDLRSPFGQIKGLLQLAQLSGELNLEQAEALALAEKASDGGLALIRDILWISELDNQKQPAQPQLIAVGPLMEQIFHTHQSLAQPKNIPINLLPPENAKASFVTDPNRLTRVLNNLLSNAIKFSPPERGVELAWWLGNDQLHVRVSDQGPGITQADQAELFKKFKKLSARPTGGEESTGLGLAIVKGLVDQLGGQIAVESQVGKGSAFTVSLPPLPTV
ncbi:MAG: tetratricopeptide repeat-containing sensor histidine kinase [Bernardetiaceae bacterium]|nr:tetratricopeptide repeat-containing sensor histidine kinase [Bernardetiaceae bacterium]